MRFNEPAAEVGFEVFFHDPARRDPRTLRRAMIAGKASDGIGYHLLVYGDPEIDCKYGGLPPTAMAYNVELIEGPDKMPSPVARCAWVHANPLRAESFLTSSQAMEEPPTPDPDPDPDIRAEYEAGRLSMPENVQDGYPFIGEGSRGFCLIACMNGNDTRFWRGRDGGLDSWCTDVKDAKVFPNQTDALRVIHSKVPSAFIAPIVPGKRGKSPNLRKSR